MCKEKTRIQTIAEECIDRWGEDSKTINFANKLGRFISQLEKGSLVGEIILQMMPHYNYYSRKRINMCFEAFHYRVMHVHGLNKETTLYSTIDDASKINSSDTLLSEYKMLNDISNRFSMRLQDIHIESFDDIENIIFIDDIIGTGKTAIKFMTRDNNLDKLQNCNVYIFCLEIMEDAYEKLMTFALDNFIDLTIEYYCFNKKAFELNHIFSNDAFEMEQIFKSFETEIWGDVSNQYVLGYNNSQAIMSSFLNTPNNTLSSFWIDNGYWRGLLPRNDDKPDFLIKKSRNLKSRYSKVRKNLKVGASDGL